MSRKNKKAEESLEDPGNWIELSGGERYFVPRGHTCWIPGHTWALLPFAEQKMLELDKSNQEAMITTYKQELQSGTAPGIVCAHCGIVITDMHRWPYIECQHRILSTTLALELQGRYFKLPVVFDFETTHQ